jgi:radical SAM protein with 4Fe4S-binding SPASM domain
MKPVRYWPRLANLFYHYRKKTPQLPYLPVRLWVELTSFCNYRCVMCPNKELEKDAHGFMDIALFKKIVDEAGEFVFDINLAHRGESLLHPQLVEMIEYAKQKKIFLRLHTNGSLLSEDLGRRLIRSGLDRLSFSFDGFDETTYESIRIGGQFNKTIKNITRFLEIKKEVKSRHPETSIEVINFNGQDSEKTGRAEKKFRELFKNLPLDSFVVKELHNWAGETKKEIQTEVYSACPFPWNALVIFWDGTVLPCTQDFFGHYPIGNAVSTSLKEIWNSDRQIHLRKQLAAREIREFKTCSQCDRVRRKSFLGVPREYLWKFITKRMP